jgi:hypothetical protein
MPTEFQCFPDYNGRPPELVCGRTYPLLGLNPDERGTVCLCPDGRNDAVRITLGTTQDPWRIAPLFNIEQWYDKIKDLNMMVAPLVFRHYAVFRSITRPTGPPQVAVDFATEAVVDQNAAQYPVDVNDPVPAPRQFLDHAGMYTLATSHAVLEKVSFVDAHERLLPIGTFMLVETSSIQQFGLGSQKRWIRGSLRYPDEEIEEDAGDDAQLRVYITLRIRSRPGEEQDVRVIYVSPENCRVFAYARITEADYTVDAIRQNIRVHAGGGGVAAVAGGSP